MKTNHRKTIGIMTAAVALLLAGQWAAPLFGAPAEAQVFDASSQRAEMIALLKAQNEKLDKIIAILDSGQLQVVTRSPDEGSRTTTPSR